MQVPATTGRGPPPSVPSRSRGRCEGASPPSPTLAGSCRPRPKRGNILTALNATSIDAAAAAVLKCSLKLHKWPLLLFLPTRSEFQIGILRTYRDSARTAQHCLAGFSPIPLFIQTSPSTQTDRLPVQASEAPNCIERFKDFSLKFALPAPACVPQEHR